MPSENSIGAQSLSAIVPLLNEHDNLSSLVENLAELQADETIIVDGGSDDGSVEWLQQNWADPASSHKLVSSKQGRAAQMNAGAAQASGDILLFLHADSRPPSGARKEILQARAQQRLWGRFDIRFAHIVEAGVGFNRAMQIVAWFMNWRSRLSGIATGDQAIFIDANVFRLVEGYADMPLMEDIAISKALKTYCKPYCSHLKIQTSARRWQQHGVLRTVVKMWWYRLAFFFGVSPQRLADRYRQVR